MPLFGTVSTAAAPHRSIGEVLALLKDEFPDITISLKVIRGRLAAGLDLADENAEQAKAVDEDDADASTSEHAATTEHPPSATAARAEPVNPPLSPATAEHAANELLDPSSPVPGTHAADAPSPGAPAPDLAPSPPTATPSATTPPAASPVSTAASEGHARRVLPEPALFSHRAPSEPAHSVFADASATSVSLTVEELAAATGISIAHIGDLEKFGLIEHRSLGSTAVYDDEALLVARAAAVFLSHGVEPRHLRMYKVAADRESGVFEQVALPLVHQRSPEARQRAIETVDELARLGEVLHSAMLRRALKNLA
jgi:hypothetical protein